MWYGNRSEPSPTEGVKMSECVSLVTKQNNVVSGSVSACPLAKSPQLAMSSEIKSGDKCT